MAKEKTIPVQKNKSKRIATISLFVMAGGFLATFPFEQTTLVKIIQGGFEAGLVGGLADWFAVTALFRHPLNIPIPHTALLPKNRDRMTKAILNVAQKELLNKDSILEKVKAVNLTRLIIGRLEDEMKKDEFKQQTKEFLQMAIQHIDKDKTVEQLHKYSSKAVEQVKSKDVVDFAVDYSLTNQYEEKVYDVALNLVEKKLSTRDTKEKITSFVMETIQKKAENNFFKAVLRPIVNVGKDKLYSTVDKAIDDILVDLKDENSENRKNIITYIQTELQNAKNNEKLIEQIDERKIEFVEGEQFSKMMVRITETGFEKLENLLQNDDFIENKVLPSLHKLLENIKNNDEVVEKIENTIKNTIATLIDENHDKIGALIKENMDKLNNDQLIDLMENRIGRELSWIRVNGAICGFLIGIVLTVTQLLLV